MGNRWIDRHKKPKIRLTKKRLLALTISREIDDWLQEKGDDVHRYTNFMDRVCEITAVVEAAIKKAEKLYEQHKDDPRLVDGE